MFLTVAFEEKSTSTTNKSSVKVFSKKSCVSTTTGHGDGYQITQWWCLSFETPPTTAYLIYKLNEGFIHPGFLVAFKKQKTTSFRPWAFWTNCANCWLGVICNDLTVQSYEYFSLNPSMTSMDFDLNNSVQDYTIKVYIDVNNLLIYLKHFKVAFSPNSGSPKQWTTKTLKQDWKDINR